MSLSTGLATNPPRPLTTAGRPLAAAVPGLAVLVLGLSLVGAVLTGSWTGGWTAGDDAIGQLLFWCVESGLPALLYLVLVVALARAWRASADPAPGSGIAAVVLMAATDFLDLHLRVAAYLGPSLHLPALVGLGPSQVTKLLVSALWGTMLLALLAEARRATSRAVRPVCRATTVTLLALGAWAVAGDILHAAALRLLPDAKPWLDLAEEGGELAILGLGCLAVLAAVPAIRPKRPDHGRPALPSGVHSDGAGPVPEPTP